MSAVARDIVDMVGARMARLARLYGDEGAARALAIMPANDAGRFYVVNREDMDTGASPSLAILADKGQIERDLPRLDLMLTRTLRARARLRAIGGIEDVDHPAPPWSFSIHSLIANVVRGIGGDPLWLLPSNHSGRTLLEAASLHTGVSFVGTRVRAGRIEIDLMKLCQDGSIAVSDNENGCTLTIRGALSHALSCAIAGQPLGRVIVHPLLAGCEALEIISATASGDSTVLHLADDHQPVRPVPGDVDDHWLKIDYVLN